MVLVSKQYKLTIKYKMQATRHFSLICQSEEDIILQNEWQVGFAAGQVDFQVTCLAGRVAVQIIIEAWHIKLSKSYRKELNICILEK
mgnify:CR=1 FL=1